MKECPKCGGEVDQHCVDVGVGIMEGPWGCIDCGWSEYEEYDLSTGRDPVDERGGVTDQFGAYWPPGSSMALAYKLAKKYEMTDIQENDNDVHKHSTEIGEG